MTLRLLLVLALGTFALRIIGPLCLGNRKLPQRLSGYLEIVPSCILAGIVISQSEIVSEPLNPRIAGLAGAALLLWLNRPLWQAIAAAVVLTGALRSFA